MENHNITDGQSEGRADVVFAIVPEWVIYSDISHGAVRLYAVLARHTNNETYLAWPSRKRIAEKMHVSPKTVDRYIKELIAINAVSVEHRQVTTEEGNHWNQSNLYTLRVAPPVTLPPKDVPRGRDNRDPRGSDMCDPRGRDMGVAQNYNHIELEPIELENTAKELFPAVIETEIEVVGDQKLAKQMFGEFWDCYGLKKKRQQAEDFWNKHIRSVELARQVIDAAVFQKANTEPEYLPHPITWLRGKRWEDDQTPNQKKNNRIFNDWQAFAEKKGMR